MKAIQTVCRRGAHLLRHTATDWRFPLYKLYTPVWHHLMKRKGLDLKPAGLEELGLSPEEANEFENVEPPFLSRVLRQLEIGPDDAILDFGAGKGAALITMSRFPFRRIVGVEISPRLAEIARSNFDRLGLNQLSMICNDAADVTDLDSFNHFYFFNPFPEVVMRRVMKNIRTSLDRRPREATIIYCNPLYHETILAESYFERAQTYFHFSVYRHKAPAPKHQAEPVTKAA